MACAAAVLLAAESGRCASWWSLALEGEPAPALPAGRSILTGDPIARMVAGFSDTDHGRAELVAARQTAFRDAARVTTLERPPKTYNVQLTLRSAAGVRRGDALMARFYIRAAGSPLASARTEFVFERAGGDYAKSVVVPVEAGFRWRRVDIPFVAEHDLPAGQAQANFRLGFEPQVIEFGGLELIKLKDKKALPAGSLSYAGREPYALWRILAERRIHKHRRGELTVRVLDAAGRPVYGAEVSARMVKSRFAFGAAVNARYLQSEPETADKRRYRKEIARLFNAAVVDNALKWSQWESQKEWGLKTVRWLRAKGLRVRGHNLVWPGWSHLPEELRLAAGRPRELEAAVEAHIVEKTRALRGLAEEWDVVNEPLHNHDLMDALGPEAMGRWFRVARREDSGARLVINETGLLNRSGEDRGQQDDFERLLEGLLKEGAPVDAIGLQAHFDSRLTPPWRILEILDRFARFGKPIIVTEFDLDLADIRDEALQADYARDFLTACYSHPAVDGVLLWEFWQGINSGNPQAAVIYNSDWSLKPSGRVWEELVLGRWRTAASGPTDRAGTFRFRGHVGDYEIKVRGPGPGAVRKSIALPRGGAAVTVRLETVGKQEQ